MTADAKENRTSEWRNALTIAYVAVAILAFVLSVASSATIALWQLNFWGMACLWVSVAISDHQAIAGWNESNDEWRKTILMAKALVIVNDQLRAENDRLKEELEYHLEKSRDERPGT